MANKIKCPSCGFEFDVDEVLEHKAEEKIKKELLKEFEADKRKIADESEQKGKKQAEAELKLLREDVENKKRENLVLKKKELEILRKEKEMKEKEENLRLEIEKEFLSKSDEREQEIRKQESEKNDMKMKELEKQLTDQKKLSEEMKRKLEQGSMQLQGEVQELALEEFLKIEFPFDVIKEVPKGVKGADVIQSVRNSLQQDCGKIIYESKRTKTFSDNWLDKLKDDQKSQQAEIAVIVTETMPKDMERFGQRNGIWICNYNEIKSLSFVLREMLLKTHSVRATQVNKGDKMELLYNFLTSTEFKQQVESIVEGFSQLKIDIDTEKRAMQKIWKEREKQIEKVINNTIDMYGSIKGIAGSAIESIKALELPEHNGT
jgi:hypothetical protein